MPQGVMAGSIAVMTWDFVSNFCFGLVRRPLCHAALVGGCSRLPEQVRIVDQGALRDASRTTQHPLRGPVSQARQTTTGEDRQGYPELMEERAHTSVYPGET